MFHYQKVIIPLFPPRCKRWSKDSVSVGFPDEAVQLAAPETSGRLSTSVQRFDFWDRLGN